MNSEWREQLERSGAVFQGDQVVSFGDAGAEAAAADEDLIADLSHYGLLQVTGQDAAEFLQGQLTNDIRQVSPGRSQLSAYCNPKGRMLAVMRVIRRGSAFLLQMPLSRLAAVQSRLRMYVMRADVLLQDASDKLVVIGLSGEGTAGLLRGIVDQVPDSVSDSCDGAVTVIRLPGTKPRFELIAEPATASELWRRLGDLTAVGPDVWGLLDALAGVPEVHEATVEAFVPQMANLDLVEGISFTKGCYTGQEVVARSHYLGKVKRRMYGLSLAAGPRPEPGQAILQVDDLNEPAQVGRLVAAFPDAVGGYRGLAVLQTSADGTALHLAEADGPALALETLPYELPAD